GPENNVASGALLTSLLVLYAKKNNLSGQARDNRGKPLEQQNGQLLSADALMRQYLGSILTEVQQKSVAKLQSMGKKDGDPKPQFTKKGKERHYERDGQRIWNDYEHAFDPDNFAYGNLQSIYRADIGKLNGSVDPATGAKNPNFLVEPKELASEYMRLVEAAAQNNTLGQPGADYPDLARQAAASLGVAETAQLQLRAALDRLHDEVAVASATYKSNKPKKPSKPRKKAGQ
ncbi:MAG TPA: hypothetical protein VKR58_04815, partial [Aquella sp.]|nr:hypothetical protein [Aquella sp.]